MTALQVIDLLNPQLMARLQLYSDGRIFQRVSTDGGLGWAGFDVALKGNFALAPIESTINVKGLEIGAYTETEVTATVSGEHIILFRLSPCGAKNGWFEVRLFDKSNMDTPIYLGNRNSGAVSISEAWDSQYTYFCFAHLNGGKTYVARFTNRASSKTDVTYNAAFSVLITPIRQ